MFWNATLRVRTRGLSFWISKCNKLRSRIRKHFQCVTFFKLFSITGIVSFGTKFLDVLTITKVRRIYSARWQRNGKKKWTTVNASGASWFVWCYNTEYETQLWVNYLPKDKTLWEHVNANCEYSMKTKAWEYCIFPEREISGLLWKIDILKFLFNEMNQRFT